MKILHLDFNSTFPNLNILNMLKFEYILKMQYQT